MSQQLTSDNGGGGGGLRGTGSGNLGEKGERSMREAGKDGGGEQDSQIGRKAEKIIMFTYFLHITGMLFLYMCITIEIINN